MKDPKCPRCGKKTATPSAENNHAFYCHHCKQAFEAIDDGTIGKGANIKTKCQAGHFIGYRPAEARK